MKQASKLQRLEFINTLERVYTGAITRQDLQATKLIEVLFGDNYDLGSSKDVGNLLSNIDSRISDELQPELYDYITDGIRAITQAGVSHAVADTISVMGDKAFDFMDIGQRLATDYINRVGEDGLRLSERIWSIEDRQAITKEVYKAIENGDSRFKLAEEISKVVKEGTPMSNIKRIVNSELSYSYSHAKADVLLSETELFSNAEAYIKVSLSPSHRIYDICDIMQGTYRADDAPLPPYHPNCLCQTETFMKVGGTQGRIDNLNSVIQKNKSDKAITNIKTIETATKTIKLPDKK